MQIQLEARETHTIQAYSDTEIKVNNISYHQSLIVSHDTIMSPWEVLHPSEVTEDLLQPILQLNPEIIILGTHMPEHLRSLSCLKKLCEQHIGIECMTLDAACRTFNVLLGEHRRVVVGFILGPKPI